MVVVAVVVGVGVAVVVVVGVVKGVKRSDRAAIARRLFAEKIGAEFQALADKAWLQERDARVSGDHGLAVYKSTRAHALEMAARHVQRELERLETMGVRE